MKFYVVVLSIYSVLSTALLGYLTHQNRQLRAQLRPPAPTLDFSDVQDVELGTAPVKGPAAAPVTVVEFTDIECPYCARGSEALEKLLEAYPGKVRLAAKQFPLAMHPNARPAARACLAAGRQGRFWEMKAWLFERQDRLGEEGVFAAAAAGLGLDAERFAADFEDEELSAQIEADLAQGSALGVRGTPTFFVNGVRVPGASYELLEKAVEHSLGSSG